MSRRRMMCKKSRLPSGYTEVEWIKSDGNQYIATNINIPSSVSGKTISYRAVHSYEGKNGFVVAITRTNTSLRYSSIYSYGTSESCYYYSDGTKSASVDNSRTKRDTTVTHYGNTECTLLSDGAASSKTGLGITSSSMLPIYLFASYNNGDNSRCKLYLFEYYEDGVLKAELVPCVRDSDGKPGMYETVSKRFYQNSGTGDFTVPSGTGD